jgi:hypothetical protein
VQIQSAAPDEIAGGVRAALALGPEAGARARERVLREFSVDARRRALHRLIDRALERSRA